MMQPYQRQRITEYHLLSSLQEYGSTAETAQKLQITRTKGRRQTAVAKKTFVSNLVGEIKGLHSKCIARIWASKIANVLTLS